MQRLRHRPKSGPEPGTRDWLYEDEGIETRRGRSPGNLARLAMEREKHTRALCAELGLPFESAAITLRAAMAAILENLPATEQEALSQDALFVKAAVPSRTTGRQALKALLAEGKIQRKGKGTRGSPYRYFAAGKEQEEERARE